jgi:hypothetical protein
MGFVWPILTCRKWVNSYNGSMHVLTSFLGLPCSVYHLQTFEMLSIPPSIDIILAGKTSKVDGC